MENAENSRPAKRPRLGPPLPDGFATGSKTSTGARSAVPQFVSGFGTAGGTVPVPPRREGQRPGFGGVASRPATKMRVLKPPSIVPNATAGPSRAKAQPTLNDTAKKTKVSTVSALRHALHVPPANPEEPPNSDEVDRPRSVSSMLHNPPTIKSALNTASLKPMPDAPPRPVTERGLTPGSPSKLKPISSTRVAKATDPRTDTGSAELLSIFLLQRGTEFVDPVEKELRRGLEHTPEKAKGGKGKGKYVRGGLAEAFSRRFAQDNTDQKLWEEQALRSFSDGKRVRADLRVKTLTILSRSPAHTPNRPHAPMVTLARCLVVDSQVPDVKYGEVTILFRHTVQGRIQKEFQIEEGAEVHVWRPWHTTAKLTGSVAPLPLPLGNLSQITTAVANVSVMCTRFYVPHQPRSS